MWLLVSTAWADAIAPGPPVCPPGFSRVIEHHQEVCAFDPLTALIEGGVLVVVIGLVVGAALFIKR